MKVLLLGAKGMLGTDLAASVPAGVTLVGHGSEIDVTDPGMLERAISAVRPEIVINATGYTAVDQAEAEPDAARAVNGTAPGLIGTAATRVGALVVHFSSDYVFSGTGTNPLKEDDPPAPLGVYGASKLEGEQQLKNSGAKYLIIRTQWLFGLNGPSFPLTMWKRAAAGQPTRVVNDQFGRPTYTVDLAHATWRLVGGSGREKAGAGGIVHVANSGVTTWYDVAREVFRWAGKAQLVTPCATAEYPTAARRPRYSALDTTRYESIGGRPLPAWQDALGRFLTALSRPLPPATA